MIRRDEGEEGAFGLILNQEKGVGAPKTSASWKVLVASREDSQQLSPPLISHHTHFSRSVMIDKCFCYIESALRLYSFLICLIVFAASYKLYSQEDFE